MLDILGSEAVQVARDLAIAGLVFIAYRTAREASAASGRISALWRGWAWCLGIAAFAAVTLGNPSCEGGDPLFGSCAADVDGGFAPTNADRWVRFFYFAALFGVPVTIGALANRFNSWGRPVRTSQ